jgi:hypothetical protein
VSDFRGIVRARFFLGAVVFIAAIIVWATALLMSPHTEPTATGVEHVRTTVAQFLRGSAIATLILSALAGWLLFPLRRPKKPVRDRVIAGVLALLAITSLYELIWVQTSVLH